MKLRAWVIGLLLFGIVLVLAVALLTTWSKTGLLTPPRPQMTWHGLAPIIPLEEAAVRGEARAKAWAEDAYLVWVKGAWQPTAEWVQQDRPAIAWSLYYYSPAEQQVASLTIKGETLFWIPPAPSPAAPEELTPFPPPQGIDVAWISFKAGGGADFLSRHPDATVQYRLKKTADSLIWVVLALDESSTFEVQVDALSGLVLNDADAN